MKDTLTFIFNGTNESFEENGWEWNNINGFIAREINQNQGIITYPNNSLVDVSRNHTGCLLNGIGEKYVASSSGRDATLTPQSWLERIGFDDKSHDYQELNNILKVVTGQGLEVTMLPDFLQSGTGIGRLYNTQRAILWLYKRLEAEIDETTKDPIISDLNIHVVGWSRGATSAIYFMTCIGNLLKLDKFHKFNVTISSVLFDPVFGASKNEYHTDKRFTELNITQDKNNPTHYYLNGCKVDKIVNILALHEMRRNFFPQTLSTIVEKDTWMRRGLDSQDRPIVEVVMPGIHDDQATSVGGMSSVLEIEDANMLAPSYKVCKDLVSRVFNYNSSIQSRKTILRLLNFLGKEDNWIKYKSISTDIGVLKKITNLEKPTNDDVMRSLSRSFSKGDTIRESVLSPRDLGYHTINIIHSTIINGISVEEEKGKFSDIPTYERVNDEEIVENYKIPQWLYAMYSEE
ncbi:hypothetical protein [Thaumasiovibrio subtropicus]|uniref:hypothetical protein n=1 Tax=Thaumasiovibrio subtropicus TaxID=1891207 RepID=UPI000B35B678|nr:hypothetical protein [Thaumasiovibrio subtropicus]